MAQLCTYEPKAHYKIARDFFVRSDWLKSFLTIAPPVYFCAYGAAVPTFHDDNATGMVMWQWVFRSYSIKLV